MIKHWFREWLGLFSVAYELTKHNDLLKVHTAELAEDGLEQRLRSEFQTQRNDLQSQLNAATLKISLLEDQVKEFHEVIETYRAVKNITDKTPEKIVTRSFTQFRTMVEKAEHEPSTT